MMILVDAHLDLAYNARHGRDVFLPAQQQPADAGGIPTVGLPDLRQGRVGLICGTLFVAPRSSEASGYASAAEAHQQGWEQLRWYQQQETEGRMRLVRRAQDLPAENDPGCALHNLVLMEGADPMTTPQEAHWWFTQGVRIVGLAWRQTRYAGGTGAPGGLTPAGVELVRELDQVGMIHDVSHLAEESFWQLLEKSAGPVIASHSNCRTLVPTDRQLSDAMIRAIIQRGGIIGMNFYDRFLLSPAEYGTRRANLRDLIGHVKHICELAGNCNHVGLGSDLDGGLGREQIPCEISTAGDMPLVGDALEQAGFTPAETRQILSGNWLRYFRKHLPA